MSRKLKNFCSFSLLVLCPWVFATAETPRILGADIHSDAFYFEEQRALGSIGERFQCALDKSSFAEHLSVLPFQRAKNMFDDNEGDVIFPMVQSASRDAWAGPTDPVSIIKPVFLTQRKDLKSPMDLKGQTVATVRGSIFHEMLISIGAEVKAVPHYTQGIRMAENERVDAALVPSILIQQGDFMETTKMTSVPLPDVRLVFYVNFQNPNYLKLVSQLNQAVSQCGS